MASSELHKLGIVFLSDELDADADDVREARLVFVSEKLRHQR